MGTFLFDLHVWMKYDEIKLKLEATVAFSNDLKKHEDIAIKAGRIKGKPSCILNFFRKMQCNISMLARILAKVQEFKMVWNSLQFAMPILDPARIHTDGIL